jgi:hypothetical protein
MAQFWSMPLTPEGRATLLRAVLAIVAGPISGTDAALLIEIRAMLWNHADRLELELTEWMTLQHFVELWGLNSGAANDLKESNRFANAVDKLLSKPPCRVVETAKPVDEHDRETINASVRVDNLDELVAVLTATASVRCDFGRGLAMRSEFSSMSHYASLFAIESGFQHSSASLSVHTIAKPKADLLAKLDAAELALMDVRNEVMVMGAAEPQP